MSENLLDLLPDTDQGLFALDPEEIQRAEAEKKSKQKTVSLARRQHRIETRRARSEAELAKLLPERLEMGVSYHVLSSGDIDSLSFLAHVCGAMPLDYCMFSTWCMAMPDCEAFGGWVRSRRISRLDAYVGEIFPSQYSDEHLVMCQVSRDSGGRLAVFRNHSKIILGCNLTYDFWFAIESSANINTNPRTENTAIHCGRDLFGFYKAYFDGIRSFNRDFDDWQPWGPGA